MTTTFYDWSGGMESSAMLVIERERIRETGAIVRWANTGKQFPEAAEWTALETRKGHSFMPLPLAVMVEESKRQGRLFDSVSQCACFGGSENVWDDDNELTKQA